MDEYFNTGNDAAQDYERLLGHRVIIYYQDQRGTDRKLVGKIVEIDGDKLWLENIHKHTGELWRGCINCAVCHIGIISTIQGWSGREATMAGSSRDAYPSTSWTPTRARFQECRRTHANGAAESSKTSRQA